MSVAAIYNIFNDTRALSRAAQVHTGTLSFEVVAYMVSLSHTHVYHQRVKCQRLVERCNASRTFQYRIRTQFPCTNYLKFDINEM